MLTETHPHGFVDERHDGLEGSKNSISIEPERLSLSEAAERGKKEFFMVLRQADARTLVRYLEKARVKLKNIPGLPVEQYASKEFRSRPYTWINPKLYLITPKMAAQMAAAELLRRIRLSSTPTPVDLQ